jgi:CheY-like chemotaxis protein
VRPNQPKPNSDLTRPNTVGLKSEALSELLDQFERARTKGEKADREFVRWGFRREAVHVTLYQPGGGNPVTLRMACRNLSCGGISLLHSAYIHTGTRAVVQLAHPDREPVSVEGSVVRCTHLKGLVHEIGIKFAQPIPAREFVQLDPFTDRFSLERVDPEALKGTIVYVDDSAAERKLVTHYLRGTSLRLRTAASGEETLKLIEEGCDLLISDFDMPGMTGVDLIRRVREAGHDTPVIMVTADTSAVTRSSLNELRISAFLAKPFPQEMLLRAIAEFISMDSGSRQTSSSLPQDHPNRGLVDGYVEQLHEFAQRLTKCIARDDVEASRSVVLQVAGSAPNFGFGAIAKLASAAAQALASTMSIAESQAQLRALQVACERARA